MSVKKLEADQSSLSQDKENISFNKLNKKSITIDKLQAANQSELTSQNQSTKNKMRQICQPQQQ